MEEEKLSAESGNEEIATDLRSKLSNFWYFYKWQFIIGMIILIGIIAAIIQMAGNSSPDAAVMYVGPAYLSVADKETMTRQAQTYMTDYNDDGEKSFSLLDINVVTKTGEDNYAYQNNVEALQRYNTEIAAGDSLIYILEPSFYRQLALDNCLAKLSDVLDADMIPDGCLDEYGIEVGKLAFFDLPGFSSIPDNCILCIRGAPTDDRPKYGRTIEYWNSNKVFFRSIFAYKSAS